MESASSLSAWCRGAASHLGRVGVVFAAMLVLFLIFALIGYHGPAYIVVTMALAISAAWLAIRFTRYAFRHSLWSLRNRLLVVYTLIGILPIVLILTLVGICAWALTSELAIYLASSELDRRLQAMSNFTQSLQILKPEYRKYAADNILQGARPRYPNMQIYCKDSTGTHSYPDGTSAQFPPSEWKDATGLLQRDGRFYAWSHLVRNGEEFTVLVPVTDEMIADLVPNLGQIFLTETPHSGGTSNEEFSRASKNPDLHFEKGKWVVRTGKRDAPAQIAVHNAGHVPPPANRFDIDSSWMAMYPHWDWQDPNRQHSAVLVVRSRPSAVLSAIFKGTDQLRSLLVGAMIAVALLFLLVEFVALVIGVSLSRRITRSVNELYEGTRRVIYGDFSHRIPVRGRDQLCELSESFNQMTGNLERLLSVEKEKERLQAELEIAREVQTQLYPRLAPPERGLRLTVHCEPARVVSGDYYDYETVQGEKLAFAIGDVAGKGISAALLMATVQAALRAQISSSAHRDSAPELDAALLVSQLNKQIYAHTSPEKYATFFFAMYDNQSGVLTYTNAGHLPPILLRGGEVVTLDTNGTVVGAFPFAKYDKSSVELEPGDLLICYTDGITEPENAYGEMFGEERLIDLVKRSAHEDDQVIIGKVVEAVRSWHAAPELADDMTLLIARRLEAAA